MRLGKFFVYFLFVLLVGSSFSVFLLSSAQVDSSVLSMSGSGWSVKVDSSLQTVLDSKAVPFTMVSKAGAEKELFLTLNSLKDCVAGQIQFKVQTLGLSVYKQLPLTEELKVTQLVEGNEYALLDGNVYPAEYDFVNSTHAMLKNEVKVYRPTNVVNSFACFDENGHKVLHIYASKLVDAKGNSVWVNSDLKNGLLTVYLDQKWLEQAVFPVVVDPTFGYTSIGGSAYAGAELQGYKVTASDSGISHYITWYGSVDSGKKVKTALYDSNQTLIQGCTEQTGVLSLGWHNFTYVTTNPNIVSGHSYTVVYWLEDGSSGNGYFDSTGSGVWAHQTIAYGAFPNPAAFTFTDLSFSIYAEVSNDTEPTPTPTPTASPSPSPSSTLSGGSYVFVLGEADWVLVLEVVMLVSCFVSLLWFGKIPILPLMVGLFAFLISLYCGLSGLWDNVVIGYFGGFVALFGGLTMLLVGLGVRVKR